MDSVLKNIFFCFDVVIELDVGWLFELIILKIGYFINELCFKSWVFRNGVFVVICRYVIVVVLF